MSLWRYWFLHNSAPATSLRRASTPGWLRPGRSRPRPFARVDFHAVDFRDMAATSLAILRRRVSGVFASTIVATCLRLRPKGRRSKAALAPGVFWQGLGEVRWLSVDSWRRI